MKKKPLSHREFDRRLAKAKRTHNEFLDSGGDGYGLYRKTQATPARDRLPFVLTCYGCDAGGEIESEVQAVLLGWSNIQYEPLGLSWTYLGNCPECSGIGQLALALGT